MKNKKMQLLQLNALIFFIMRSGYLGIGLSGYIKFGGPNAFLCPLIGGILGIVPLFLFLKISKLSPENNINDLLKKSFGQIIGSIICILLFLFIAFYCIIIFWDLNNFIASEYLYNTPIIAIVIILIIPIIYILTKGIQTLGRSSIILAYISLFLYFLSVVGLTNQIDLTNIFPFLEHGFFDIIKGSIIYISYSVLPLFIILIIPRNRFQRTDKLDKSVWITYFIVTFFLTFITFIIVSVLGIELASLYQYADYHVLRRITIGTFIQRVESLLAVQWIISLFVLISISLYYVISSIRFIFKIKSKKVERLIIFIVCILIMYTSTIIFKNNTVSMNFTIYYFPYIILFILFFLPLIIYFYSKKALK